MKVPQLGPSVPRRGNAFSRAVGQTIMSGAGWRFEGTIPDNPKFVIIVAPHTSNWDFPLGVAALFSLGFRVSFLGKHSLFTWPLGAVMRWLGGIPVDRSVRKDRVAESVAAFKSRDQLILAVAPEGTRKHVATWKSGFYHVAYGAGVPILPVAFDYGDKVIRLGAPFIPTGNADADIARLRDFYRNTTGKNPSQFQP